MPNTEALMNKYPVRLVLREIFLTSTLYANLKYQRIYLLLSFAHALMPIAVVYAYDKICSIHFSVCEDNWKFPDDYKIWDKYSQPKFYIFHFCSLFINCLVFYTNLFFLLCGAVDMKKRLWNMRALSSVIETNRLKVRNEHLPLP